MQTATKKVYRAAKADGGGRKSWGVIFDNGVSPVFWVLNPCFSRADAVDAAGRRNESAALVARWGTDNLLEIAKQVV